MASDLEAQNYSTLEARRPESGIEPVGTVPSRSPVAQPSTNALVSTSPPASVASSQGDPGIIVASPQHCITTPSTLESSDRIVHQFVPEEGLELKQQHRRVLYLRPKYFWSVFALTFLVVAVTVGVAVGITVRDNKRDPTTVDSPLPIGTTNSTSPALSPRTGLASVAWNDTDGVTQHRVYYQDGDGYIRESSWDPWTISWLSTPEPIGRAKPDTPIAAAVAGSSTFRFQLNVYALSDLNYVQQWFTADLETWVTGPISKKNKLASNSSSLAAAWHGREGCNTCPNNFLLVYQDTMGNLQLGNATIGVGWHWDQLQAHPLPGTGISLALFWWPNAPIGLRLFYQNQDLSLCSLNWGTSNSSTGIGLWALEESPPITMIPEKAPIAAFTWGTAAGGVPQYLDTLSSGPNGVMVNQWAGDENQWLPSYSPIPMQDAQNYSSVAANNAALAYAILDDAVWEFGLKPKGRRWVPTGQVWP